MKENILDGRFTGKSAKIKVIGVDGFIEGVIDEVSRYEIGLRTRDGPVIVFRHAVLFIEVQPPDLHGYSQEELEDTVLTTDFIGCRIDVTLVDGSVLKGKLMKVTRYELGVVTNEGKALVIPKSSIATVSIKE